MWPAIRPDCAVLPGQDGTWCTFEQEAQNYANWFTYYRSRLFAAVGVMSEVLSNFIGPEQFLRLGYGRINYFPRRAQPLERRQRDRPPGRAGEHRRPGE